MPDFAPLIRPMIKPTGKRPIKPKGRSALIRPKETDDWGKKIEDLLAQKEAGQTVSSPSGPVALPAGESPLIKPVMGVPPGGFKNTGVAPDVVQEEKKQPHLPPEIRKRNESL